MQRLIMPFKRQMMLCGYKNAEYKKHWGYPHYGVDISTIQGGAGDDPTVYASGDGIVLAAGKDNTLGYGICIFYSDVYDRTSGRSFDVVGRYMHLRSISVITGDVVKAGTPLGVEGKEGTGDYHLHLEFDTDLQYPAYSPQVSAGHSFWKKGTDSTLDPSSLLHVGAGQVIVDPTYNPAWLNESDLTIPDLPVVVDYEKLYAQVVKERDEAIAKLEKIYGGLRDLLGVFPPK